MTPAIWYCNGEWLNGIPVLPVNDVGLMTGAVITDRVRTFAQRPFRLVDHFARFRRSCELAGVPLNATNVELHRIVHHIVAEGSNGDDFAIVLLATPTPSLVVHSLPLDFARYRPVFTRGAHLVIPPIRQIPGPTLNRAIKHRSRLHWWIAQQQAKQVDSSSDALLMDDEDCVTETATANLIVVKNHCLFTPPTTTVLPGITLQTIRDMCSEMGLTVCEKKLRPADCYAADELLLTCTSWCLAGVSQLDGRPIPWPGPIYQRLAKVWSERVSVDYVDQILKTKT